MEEGIIDGTNVEVHEGKEEGFIDGIFEGVIVGLALGDVVTVELLTVYNGRAAVLYVYSVIFCQAREKFA